MVGMATIRGLFKLKNAAKNDWTDQTINKLPITTDPDTASVMKTLSRFFLITYVCKPELIPLVIVKNIKMTFEKGVSIYSPPSFASLGMIISHSMGDDEMGKKLASFSLRLVGRLKNIRVEWQNPKRCLSRTRRRCTGQCSSRPVGSRTLRRTKSVCARATPFSALWSAHFYCWHSFDQGTSLALLEAEALSFTKVAEDCGCILQRDCLYLHRQVALNLQGNSPESARFDGTRL